MQVQVLTNEDHFVSRATISPLRWIASCSWWLLLLVLLPNLMLWVLFGFGSQKGFFNIEFGTLLAAYLLCRRWPLLIIICLSLLADLFAPIARIFYFRIEDAVDDLYYLSVLPASRLALYILTLAAYLLAATALLWFATRHVPNKKTTAAVMVAFCLSALLCGKLTGQFRCIDGCDERAQPIRVARSPSTALVYNYRLHIASLRKARGAPKPMDSPMAQLLREDADGLWLAKPNVAVLTVESWGLSSDRTVRDTLLAPFLSQAIRDRYDVELGAVPFKGATMYGEGRDLCGQYFDGGAENATAEQLHACYPAMFAAKGYRTVGIHGFYPHMYGRERWFPAIGFQESLYSPQLSQMGFRTCDGGFVGTCDADVAEYVHKRLLASGTGHPLFIHWMTLDSHLPVNVSAIKLTAAERDLGPVASSDQAICAWHALVLRVNQEIAAIVADPTLAPTVFLLSGDHAPPFYDANRRALFSQDHVPYLILKPKALAAAKEQ